MGNGAKGDILFREREYPPLNPPRERFRLAVSGLNNLYAFGMQLPARGVAAVSVAIRFDFLLSSAVAQPLAALLPYGCGVPLAGASLLGMTENGCHCEEARRANAAIRIPRPQGSLVQRELSRPKAVTEGLPEADGPFGDDLYSDFYPSLATASQTLRCAPLARVVAETFDSRVGGGLRPAPQGKASFPANSRWFPNTPIA